MRRAATGTRRGAFTIEASVVWAVSILAAAAIMVYGFRIFCDRYRQAGDSLGYGRQYEPGVTTTQ